MISKIKLKIYLENKMLIKARFNKLILLMSQLLKHSNSLKNNIEYKTKLLIQMM